ncbi:hypothetical protein Q7P37_003200 [Cladosporium fusiforme]
MENMDAQETPSAAGEHEATATPLAASTDDTHQHQPPGAPEEAPPQSHTPEPIVQQNEDVPLPVEQPVQEDPGDSPKDTIAVAPVAPHPEPSQPSMATPQPAKTPSRGGSASARGSRSSKRVSFPIVGEDTPMADATPSSAPRGRPPGRPRGSRARGPTRASTRGSRGGKRKRADDDDGEGGSSDSEIYAPTTTKSGRSVQKPTSFVPPPQPSPPTMPMYKKKRTYRRNPESAVCKVCLRGVSPANNMIVFCDGCNVPYHRYCHQPPIDQSVIDEVDKEWYCKQCERERIQPVPEAHVVGFVSAEGASAEEVGMNEPSNVIQTLTFTRAQRQKYFSNLPPGVLVTLLTKATTLHPDLPLFDPSFRPNSTPGSKPTQQPTANGNSHPPIQPLPAVTAPILRDADDSDHEYGSDEHPPHYPRPGQGFMSTLPPEKEDLHYLVDEENSKGVFTHVYQEEQKVQERDVNGGAEQQ